MTTWILKSREFHGNLFPSPALNSLTNKGLHQGRREKLKIDWHPKVRNPLGSTVNSPSNTLECDNDGSSRSKNSGPRTASQSSKPGACRSLYSGLPWDLCGEQVGSGSWNRLSSAIVWLVRHVAWLITRYNTGRDGCSPFRRIFGKSYDGGICKFGEQIHYKLSGHPSSRVEPR